MNTQTLRPIGKTSREYTNRGDMCVSSVCVLKNTLACYAGQSLFEDANSTDTHVPSICIVPRCFSNMTERLCFQFREDLNNFGHLNCFDYFS